MTQVAELSRSQCGYFLAKELIHFQRKSAGYSASISGKNSLSLVFREMGDGRCFELLLNSFPEHTSETLISLVIILKQTIWLFF